MLFLMQHIESTSLNILEDSTVPLYTYQIKHGAKWLQIFHHKTPLFFDDSEDAKFSKREGLFSILSLISEEYKIHGQYEFLLEYPDEESSFNRWLQTKFPLKVETSDSSHSEGYEAVSISWPYAYYDANTRYEFNGLGLSSYSKCLIDGVEDSRWYFCIGQSNTDYGPNKLAGHRYDDVKSEVILWLRVEDKIIRKYPKVIYSLVLCQLILGVINNEFQVNL